MSVWRRKAIACMPEYRHELERKNTSIYSMFSILLGETIRAHKNNDRAKLSEYYAFAEWCFNQQDKTLWNAAAVSFYEHLIDTRETTLEIAIWVKKDIYIRIRGLFVFRVGEEKARELDKSYNVK